jgi:phosphate transport system substrate-binding protein
MRISNSLTAALLSVGLSSVLAATGCGKSEGKRVTKDNGTTTTEGGDITLTGAGATFPYPLYSKWTRAYHDAHPNIKISYQSIGSGGGIRQITETTVDFGASDAPMSDEELAKAPGKLMHIPMTIGAVALVFNVDGVDHGLKLTSDATAKIFLGEIKKWNDPAIAATNEGMKLPNTDITVAYRSDGSGTTAVFTDYLSAVSPAWKEKVGAGKAVKFPTGLGAKGNEGVAGQVKTTPGTIGYVELAYAIQTKASYAELQNQAGKFVAPSLEGISAAAAGAVARMPEDYRISIVNAPGDDAYPIAAFTYLLVYEDMQNATKGKTLADFLWWAVHDGQAMGPDLHYAKLPAELVVRVEKTLRTLKAGGAPALEGR